jgi:hypothetical protein
MEGKAGRLIRRDKTHLSWNLVTDNMIALVHPLRHALERPTAFLLIQPPGGHGRGADEAGVVAELGQEHLAFAVEVVMGSGFGFLNLAETKMRKTKPDPFY